MDWLVELVPASSTQPPLSQGTTKFPAELPQLSVRVVPPQVLRIHENLLTALAGGVGRREPIRMNRMNRKKASLAKLGIRVVSVFCTDVSPE